MVVIGLVDIGGVIFGLTTPAAAVTVAGNCLFFIVGVAFNGGVP